MALKPWNTAGWYQERVASHVIWEIKAKYLVDSHASQPKSILMNKAAIAIKL